jgi:lysozyme
VSARRAARWATWITLALAAAGVLLFAFYPQIELAALVYKVRGVDVSAHQGQIDWVKLKADDVAFAYIKASEGEDFVDANFLANWHGAANVGMPRGAYHFFTQCRSGMVQAQNFIATAPTDPAALPPVVDIEHMGPCTQGPAVANLIAEIDDFLDAVEAHYGKRPILYTTREFHDAYLVGNFTNERFWIRSLGFPPGFREKQWVFWQYHNKGLRDGVTGPIDLNAFRGAQAELDALTQ